MPSLYLTSVWILVKKFIVIKFNFNGHELFKINI